MLYRRQFAWILSSILSAVMLASGGMTAVSQTGQQPQSAPGQKPAKPKTDDDTTLPDDEVLRVETDLT
ncbi:MAG TPA: hypothetical protein VM943_06505, partial [Pyrinomonadaceae bacterium]|nr:hypothetical protein [Pyrinomonadaceae bacterium]